LGRSCSDDWNAPAKHIARRLYAYTGRPSLYWHGTGI
jgi:hypothetical protein